MPDLSDDFLRRHSTRTLPGLALPAEFILPDYGGGSIVNLAGQVSEWLGAGRFGLAPLHAQLTEPLGTGIRQVIVVIADAMGFARFRRMLTETGSVWDRLARAGVLAPITSVFPSTTTAALTSVWTGAAPGEHGMLGYEMWLREFGVTANMITLTPKSVDGRPELLVDAGLDPATFLPVPTLPGHLAAHGIKTHAFLPKGITRSGLSKMHLGESVRHPFNSPADLWHLLRGFLEDSAGRRQLVFVYWDMVDTHSHAYGPAPEPSETEARSLGEVMASACLDRLSPRAREGTVLVVFADHGQVDTPLASGVTLAEHPAWVDMLHILPTGEHRAAYLHCRPGSVDAVREYIESRWPERFHVVSQADVMWSGLLGERLEPRAASRLGEWLVLSRGDAFLWWAPTENRMLGRHGSLTAGEMLVPFLAARLEAW